MCEFERIDQVRDWLFGLYDDGVFGDLGFKRPITKYSYGISSHVYMKNDLVNVSHRIIFLSFKCGVSFEINPWNITVTDRKGLKKYFFIHGKGTLIGNNEYGWSERHLNKPDFYDWLIMDDRDDSSQKRDYESDSDDPVPEQERDEENADDLNSIPEDKEKENIDVKCKYYDLYISNRNISVNDYCIFNISSAIQGLIDDVIINLSDPLMFEDYEIRDYKILRFACNSILYALNDVKNHPWNSDDIQISLPYNVIQALLRAISFYRSVAYRDLRDSIYFNESGEEEKHELEALKIAESRFGRAIDPFIDFDIDDSSDIELPF